jgi:hypothetical protein
LPTTLSGKPRLHRGKLRRLRRLFGVLRFICGIFSAFVCVDGTDDFFGATSVFRSIVFYYNLYISHNYTSLIILMKIIFINDFPTVSLRDPVNWGVRTAQDDW